MVRMFDELPFATGDVVADKYRLDQVLGEGGMGVVVAAHHVELDQRVAIKFLLPQIASRKEAAERFRREARAAAKIQSEHVVRVLDVGSLDGGIQYMVMEYLEGEDLAQTLTRQGTLSIDLAVSYVLQAIEAVSQAHASGIVHRDLKPANLFLAKRPDGSARIKVLDFGISKSLIHESFRELSLTKSASLMGSPMYMSPEQMQSARDVDSRTDIWSLGAILYELITGCAPFPATTLPQLCAALLNDDPVLLRELRPEVPEGLEAAILRCLQKDRTRRWPTVSELADAITPFALADAGVHAERARRVLNSADITLSDLERSRVAGNLGNIERSHAAASIVDAPATERMSNTPTLKSTARTVNSWGQTNEPPPPKRSMPPIWIAAAVGIVLLIGIGVVYMSGANAVAQSDPGAVPTEVGAAATPATLLPETEQGHAQSAKNQATQGDEPEVKADPGPAKSDDSAAGEEKAGDATSAAEKSAKEGASSGTKSQAASAAGAPQKKPTAKTVKKPAAKETPAKSAPSTAISDFGGRR